MLNVNIEIIIFKNTYENMCLYVMHRQKSWNVSKLINLVLKNMNINMGPKKCTSWMISGYVECNDL